MATTLPFMACGHTAQGTTADGDPVCVICVGLDLGAKVVHSVPPSLEGRQAQCTDCRKVIDSAFGLAFFEYKPKAEYDRYYCGCRGWN